MNMIEPKEVEIELPDGSKKAYIISKFDAVSGREIVTQYPTSGMPKLGEYKTNEEIMLKMMNFAAVDTGTGDPLHLTTRELINNHVRSWETLARLEWALMEYNCSFFSNGKVSNFLEDLTAKLPEWILSILTPLLEQSSLKEKPPSGS